MKILHINNNTNINHLNKFITSGKDVFILIYMEGCMPCNKVRPEWKKLEDILTNKPTKQYSNVIIAQVESENLNNIHLKSVPTGFPTIKYISDNGNIEETYENERNVNALMEWINSKLKTKHPVTTRTFKKGYRSKKGHRVTKRNRLTGGSKKRHYKHSRRKKIII